jgi:hypothetical protein
MGRHPPLPPPAPWVPWPQVWEDREGALINVHTEWVAGPTKGQAGGFRLLTLRSRILEVDLLD